MNFEVGTKVSYSFPEGNKTTIGEIVFVGEETIHLKSVEGFLIKVRWMNFDNIQEIDNSEILVA